MKSVSGFLVGVVLFFVISQTKTVACWQEGESKKANVCGDLNEVKQFEDTTAELAAETRGAVSKKEQALGDIEEIAISMIADGEWESAKRLLSRSIAKPPRGYRLVYLAAITNQHLGFFEESIDQFASLLGNQHVDAKSIDRQPSHEPAMKMFWPIVPQKSRELVFFSYVDSQSIGKSIVSVGSLERHLKQIEETLQSTPGDNRRQEILEKNRAEISEQISKLRSNSIREGLPRSAQECRVLSLNKLKAMTDSLSSEFIESIRAAVKDKGVRNAELVFDLNERLSVILKDPSQVLKKHPNDEALQALLALSIFRRKPLDGEDAFRAYQTFRDRNSQLALLFSICAAGSNQKHHGLLDAELAKFDALPPHDSVIYAIAILLTGNFDPFDSLYGFDPNEPRQTAVDPVPRLSQQQRTLLTRKITKRFFDANPSDLTFVLVAKAIENELTTEEWVQFVDKGVKQFRETKLSLRSKSCTQSENPIFSPMAFPPLRLDSLPPVLIHSITTVKDQWPAKQWLEEFEGPVFKTENLIIKALLLSKQIQQQKSESRQRSVLALEELLDRGLSEKPSSTDFLLLKTALASYQQQWEKAFVLLKKLDKLSLSRNVRRHVDRAILHLALTEISNGWESSENEGLLAIARPAARRKFSSILKLETLSKLKVTYSALGMDSEVPKIQRLIDKQQKPARKRGNPPIVPRVGDPRHRNGV